MNEIVGELSGADAPVAKRRTLDRVTRLSGWVVPLGTAGTALGSAVVKDGGRSAADWNISLALVGFAALLYWLAARADDRAPALDGRLAWLVVLAPAYVVLQLIPLPQVLVQILSPTRAHLLDLLGTVGLDVSTAPLSVNPAATSPHVAIVLGCAVTFLHMRDLAWRLRMDAPWAVTIPLIAVAVFEATLGFAQGAVGAEVRGTYQSNQHFAGLLEMTLPLVVACGIAVALVRRSRREIVGRRIVTFALLSGASLLIGALVRSASAIGVIAAFCGIAAMAMLALATVLERRTKLAILCGLSVAILVLVGGVPSNRLVRAFAAEDTVATASGRLPVWRDTLGIVGEYPLTGSGLGTFGSAFQKYQTTDLGDAPAHANNDYLQLLAELGLLGAALFLALMVTAHQRAARTATTSEELNARLLGLGCTASSRSCGKKARSTTATSAARSGSTMWP